MKLKGTVFIALLLSSFALVALPATKPTNATTTALYLHPATVITDPPAIFTLDLKVDNVVNLRAWDIVIRWDPDIIRLQSIVEGPFLGTSGQPTEFLHSLYLEYELSAAGLIVTPGVGVTGSGVLATLTFKCIDTGDPFDVIFMESKLIDKNDNYIGHTATGSRIITQSPVVKFARKVLTDVSGQRVNDQDPAPGDTVRFDARASYAQPKLVADIDRSGRVDSGDLGALGFAWFKVPGMPGWSWDADIDMSGRVDSGDLGLLGQNWFKTGGRIVNFKWEVDGVVIAQGKDKSVIEYAFPDYSDEDGFTVKLTVTDGAGRSWYKTTQVLIWRDIAAIDCWPCYDWWLGDFPVMDGDEIELGTTLYITGAYRNLGTLKQNFVLTIYLRNVDTQETITIATLTRTNFAPAARSTLWTVYYVVDAPEGTYVMGIKVESTQPDFNSDNNVFEYSARFTVVSGG